jgi:uncharacterized protein
VSVLNELLDAPASPDFASAQSGATTLLPAAVTTAPKEEPALADKTPGDERDVDAVFAKLKQLGGKSE